MGRSGPHFHDLWPSRPHGGYCSCVDMVAHALGVQLYLTGLQRHSEDAKGSPEICTCKAVCEVGCQGLTD